MQNVEAVNETYNLYRYQTSVGEPQLDAVPRSVLIVEDDLAFRPLWEKVFEMIDKDVRIDWAVRAEDAENLIRFKYTHGTPYHLVIADISLEGSGTGIDLWNRYGEEVTHFAVVSALPISSYDFYTALDFGHPPYYKKPLSVKVCLEIANLLDAKVNTRKT